MSVQERPIENGEDDLLNRTDFSRHLGRALLSRDKKESLIVALNGEWGSGRSSLINLVCDHLSASKEKPTIIEFNPWMFSSQKSLSEHFFEEIAHELKIRRDCATDKKIADKLLYYSALINLTPDERFINKFSSKFLLILGLLGISISQAVEWFNVSEEWIKYASFAFGFTLIFIDIAKDYLTRLGNFHRRRSNYKKRSVRVFKDEIISEFSKRKKKLIVVIDDIDHLNQSEIKQLFRLIRINADFPNMVYFLAYDRNIIEENLAEKAGVCGRQYLDKIVHVDFEMPQVGPGPISTIFFEDLDRLMNTLPESSKDLCRRDDPYLAEVYNPGLKGFFRNIKDVKRFMAGLDFNVEQMYRGNRMKVNPIDFVAIEAIREFAPDLYNFMKDRKYLFTSTDLSMKAHADVRICEIEEQLSKLPDDVKENTTSLMKVLFPQIYGDNSSQAKWSNNLRVCSMSHFDCYFTLVPGRSEAKISHYEMEYLFSTTGSAYEFESVLRKYIEMDNIRAMLQQMQKYVLDEGYVSRLDVLNVVLALFNICDDLPKRSAIMLDYGAGMDLLKVIDQLLKRGNDKKKEIEILENAIPLSRGLYGPVATVSLLSCEIDDSKSARLQELCLDRILECQDSLQELGEFIYILYKWCEWDDRLRWKGFVDRLLDTDESMLLFLDKFVTRKLSYPFNDHRPVEIKGFNFRCLVNFVKLDDIRQRLTWIKKKNKPLYRQHKQLIDMIID